MEGRGNRECGLGSTQGLRPQGEREGQGLAGDRGTQEDRKHRAEERAGSELCPGVFSFTARYPPRPEASRKQLAHACPPGTVATATLLLS